MPDIPNISSNDHMSSAATLAAQNDGSMIVLPDGTGSGESSGTGKTGANTSASWWVHPAIDATRWNQSFPFQLLIVEAQGGGAYRLSKDGWKFTLPIGPEALSISMPFAITTSVTLGGIVEEHNAAPIKMISLNGTTGVLPLKGVSDQTQLNALGTLATAAFAGTINNLRRTAAQVKSAASNFDPAINNFKPNLVGQQSFTGSSEIGKTSGYYQFKLLEQFLENYAQIKKTDAGKNLRLAFAMWKDNSIYLVTPQQFVVERKAGAPLEYQYQLQFKAWRRITLNGAKQPSANTAFKPVVSSPNGLAAVLNFIQDARRVLSDVQDTMNVIVQDVNNTVYEPLRQTALFLKDTLGVALTMNDLPANIILASRDAIAEWSTLNASFSSFGKVTADHDRQNQERFKDLVALANAAGKGNTKAGAQPNVNIATLAPSSPITSVFNNPQGNAKFFDNIRVGDLHLAPTITKMIVSEREKVRQLTRLDFEKMRDTIEDVAANYANAVGAGNATYDATYNRPYRAPSKTPTTRDWDVLFALNRASQELSRLAASGTIDNHRTLSSVEFVAGLARRSGIAFTIPRSKYAVPFPYNYTLEKLSQLYLGTPDRWEEIAALNGLRSPYVDEVGFDLPLLVNGNGNTIVVGDSSKLYVGQQVWLSSSSTSRTIRRITRIENITPTQAIVTVDGLPDLSRFITLAQASLHAFLPDTVNSQMMIYIPSDGNPVDVDFKTKAIPGINQFDQLLAVGGVDLLLTEQNDLAITPDGDCKLAVGMTNIIQDVRLRLSCPRGGLMGHPSYGFPIQPGMSVADIDAKSFAEILNGMFADDPMYTGVYGVKVSINGPVAPVTMAVGIQGVQDHIPITVNIPR